MFYEKDALVLLFESTQQGGDVLGRCYISMKTVFLIWFGDFTSILLFVGVFPSRSYCVALDREIDAGLEIERFRIGIVV